MPPTSTIVNASTDGSSLLGDGSPANPLRVNPAALSFSALSAATLTVSGLSTFTGGFNAGASSFSGPVAINDGSAAALAVLGQIQALGGIKFGTVAADATINDGDGSPNGVVTAPRGSLYLKRDAPAQLWQNTDGATAWTQVGGGTIPTFSGAKVHNSANTTNIGTGATVALGFDAELFDTDNYHSTVSNTTRLTAPTTGYYEVNANLFWLAQAGGQRALIIRKNGSQDLGNVNIDAVAAVQIKQTLSCIVQLNATDYVEMLASQDSGSTVQVLTRTNPDYTFSIARLGQ